MMKISCILVFFYFFTIADTHSTCLKNIVINNISTFVSPKEMVVSDHNRLYLYSFPDESCKLNDTFFINNDRLLSYYESNGYSYVNYLNKNKKIIDGWVHTNDLAKIKKIITQGIKPLSPDDFQVFYKTYPPIKLGVPSPQFDAWTKKITLTTSEPTLAGIDENNWLVSFEGGYVVLNEANDIIRNRLKFSGYSSNYETYLAVFNISGAGFKTFRSISVGDKWKNVNIKYGKNNAMKAGGTCVYYRYFNKKITFCEVDNKVNSIELSDVVN